MPAKPAITQFDPARPDFTPYGMAFGRWTPRPMRRADRHNEIELNLLTGGSITYLLGGRRVTVPAGRLAAFWAAVPHQVVEVDARHPYYVVTVPLIWFLQRGLSGAFVQAIMAGGLLIDAGGDEAVDARLMDRWVQDAASDDPTRRRVVLLELEARLLRLAMACTADTAAPPAAAPADGFGHVDRMLGVIAAAMRPLTIDDIVRPTRLHPNYAMALFRKLFGMTLVDCLTQHRITHAQRLLVTTERAVAAVALDSGFQSLSRFNEAFKRLCACTPREFRKRHAAF